MAVSVQALLTDATNLNKIQMYRPVNTVFLYCSVLPRYLSSVESRPRDKGVGGGGSQSPKNLFWSKNKGEEAGSPGSLPWIWLGGPFGFIHWKIVAALLKYQRFNRMEAYVDI